jgi:ATP-dependent exoDNAse (exonuclease V) beta subunit
MRQSPTTARGVPLFKGKDTVLPEARPDGQQPDASTVRPGAYELVDPATGASYTVVWWDPLLLEEAAGSSRGVRREDLIEKTAGAAEVAADRKRYDDWRARRQASREKGATASLQVVTATEAADDADATDKQKPQMTQMTQISGVQLEDASTQHSIRPSGKRFGTLVHALLATIPLEASATEIRELAALHARLFSATDEERDVASAITANVLKHPRLKAAREAESKGSRVWREAPVLLRVDDGAIPRLVDGQVDLAYETDEGWMVIDFKTDIEIVSAQDAYKQQVALYAAAISKVTGRPAAAVLLRV